VGAFTLVTGIAIFASPIVAIAGRGDLRWAACGFAVVSWLYCLCAFNFVYIGDVAPGPFWIVNELAVRLSQTLPQPDPPTPGGWPFDFPMMILHQNPNLSIDSQVMAKCYCVLHSLTAFIMGCLGACLMTFVSRRASDPPTEAKSP